MIVYIHNNKLIELVRVCIKISSYKINTKINRFLYSSYEYIGTKIKNPVLFTVILANKNTYI